MYKNYSPAINGSQTYRGFLIDLIEALATTATFNYSLQDTATTANELVDDLTDDKIDLALVPLTITEKRMQLIDFSSPLMSVGLSIVLRKPSFQYSASFTFLFPFSSTIWILIFVAFILVSSLLTLIARHSNIHCKIFYNSL